MKHSKTAVRGKARAALDVRFETQSLTSYSGLILYQHFFLLIGIKERLWRCFRHLKVSPTYSHHVIMMLLVVHLIIGHRRLRDVDYYRDDEMVKRVLGLKRLPDVSTISRAISTNILDFRVRILDGFDDLEARTGGWLPIRVHRKDCFELMHQSRLGHGLHSHPLSTDLL